MQFTISYVMVVGVEDAILKKLSPLCTLVTKIMIKAIDTRYNNHLFRSRLEARWAVYFDKLAVKWEYEPEGYVLSDGSKYLPDFWLPDHDMYAEVKPGFKFDPRWHLFINGIQKPIIILVGVPKIYEQRLYMPGHAYPMTANHYMPAFLLPPGWEFFPFFSGGVNLYYKDDKIFTNAVEAACSARFESITHSFSTGEGEGVKD